MTRAASLGNRALAVLTLGVAPLGLVAAALVAYVPVEAEMMADFHTFWSAGHDVLEGRAGGFVYGAPAAIAMAPLALLPYGVAAAVFSALLVVSFPATLLVLGVRDWRCHGAALLAAPTVAVFGSGALSSLLALAAALAWRYRDRRWAAAAFVAAAIVAKIFLWPLLFWLAATRRARTAGIVVGGGAAAALVGWAAIGFAGLREYPAMLIGLASSQQADGYSPIAVALALGAPSSAARIAALVLGAALLGLAVAIGRRDDGDRRSFGLAVTASLVLSPVVWLHYFVLLLVPLGLARPRFSPLWLAPLALWACPMKSHGELVPLLAALTVVAVVAVLSDRRPRPSSPQPDPPDALGAPVVA